MVSGSSSLLLEEARICLSAGALSLPLLEEGLVHKPPPAREARRIFQGFVVMELLISLGNHCKTLPSGARSAPVFPAIWRLGLSGFLKELLQNRARPGVATGPLSLRLLEEPRICLSAGALSLLLLEEGLDQEPLATPPH